MKALYEAPEVEYIDFAAMESIAAIPGQTTDGKSITGDDEFE